MPFDLSPPEPTPRTISTVLLKAAELIRTHGLAKFLRQDDAGQLCIHGAICMALYNNPYGANRDCDMYDPAQHKIGQLIRRELGHVSWPGDWGCAYWNNAPERTAEEVIAVLIKTAAAEHAAAAL